MRTNGLLVVLAVGCASAELPTTPADMPPAVGPDDDGGPAVSVGAPSVSAPSDDDGAISTASLGDDAADDGASLGDVVDGSPSSAAPPFDPGEAGVCTGSLSPADLVIDEIMIEPVAGTGDHGEWMEVKSALPCAVDLRGLQGEVPNASKVRTFIINDDLWIPAFGFFVVADSNIAALNHDLPGTVVVWSGQPGDVFRNKGDTITLTANGILIDSLTYPSMSWLVGVSYAFPSGCPPTRLSDWSAWQPSRASFFPGFYGTPNAPNDDVVCP